MELSEVFSQLISASPYTVPLVAVIVILLRDRSTLWAELLACRGRNRALYRHLSDLPAESIDNGN